MGRVVNFVLLQFWFRMSLIKKNPLSNICSSRRDRQVINKNVVKIETRLWTTLIYYFLRLSGFFFYLFWCKAATCLPERDIGKNGKNIKNYFRFLPPVSGHSRQWNLSFSKRNETIYIFCVNPIYPNSINICMIQKAFIHPLPPIFLCLFATIVSSFTPPSFHSWNDSPSISHQI